ncbi:MAG: hypothetical protein IRZ14_20425 [Chloroflexi bacterium]|nr:hypothetical protein [Chloroflexota bacterium]
MAMDFLQSLLGGQRRAEYDDFVRRYEQGPPSEGYSNQEVVQRYREVAPRLPAEAYEQSAEEAFQRLSPEERRAFAEWLRQRSRQEGVEFPDLDRDGRDDRLQDPRELARAMARVQQRQPDVLERLLGGQSGTALDNPLVKAALAGVAAMAAKRILSGR